MRDLRCSLSKTSRMSIAINIIGMSASARISTAARENDISTRVQCTAGTYARETVCNLISVHSHKVEIASLQTKDEPNG